MVRQILSDGGYDRPRKPAGINVSASKSNMPAPSAGSFSKVGGAISLAPSRDVSTPVPAAYSAPSSSSFQRTGMVAPVANYQATPAQSPAIQGGYGGGQMAAGNGGGGAEMAGQSMSRKPMQYGEFSDDMAATDSIFTDQKSAYANALKKFIEDNDRQSGILDQDAGMAQQGIARNRTNGLTGLSEDFASRGLSSSGMFRQELDNADTQYGKQKEQVVSGLKNAKDDLGFRKAKYEQENGENGTNIQAARREAFARLAASQGLT